MDTSAQTTPTTENTYACFAADRLRWVYAARAHLLEARMYLQNVLIEPAGPTGGVYIVASNGALMMIAYDAKGTASHRFTFDPLEEIANICGFPDNEEKLFDGSSYADIITIAGGTLTACRDPLRTTDKAVETDSLIKVLSQEIEIGEYFPEWRSLATSSGAHNPTPAFIDPNLLSLALVGTPECTKAISLTRYVCDGEDAAHQPVHISFESLPLRGVLMPMGNTKDKPPIARCAMPFDAA